MGHCDELPEDVGGTVVRPPEGEGIFVEEAGNVSHQRSGGTSSEEIGHRHACKSTQRP